MNRYQIARLERQVLDLQNKNELFIKISLVILALLVIIIIRNWYNLYKKRSFRRKNKQLTVRLDAIKLKVTQHDNALQEIKQYKKTVSNKLAEIFQLKQELKEYKERFYSTLSKKEQEIAQKTEAINNQRKAYERYVNFKNVETNNTRLGAHFIKNVISQIYSDLEQNEQNLKSFLGIHYNFSKEKNKIPSIKALKNIFKLLDYNVSALNKENISINEELEHVNMFLDLIQYLKPNTKIELKNKLTRNQKKQLRIKPTLFFPFVENALKHGSLNDDNSFISILLKAKNDKQLKYCLVNSVELKDDIEKEVKHSSNFGLKALRQLLDAYYPNSTLEHRILPNKQYISELTLNIN